MLFWLALEPPKRLLLMFYYQFYYQSNYQSNYQFHYQFHYQTQKDLSLIVNLIVDLGCGVPSDPFNPVLSRFKILAYPFLGIYTKLQAAFTERIWLRFKSAARL